MAARTHDLVGRSAQIALTDFVEDFGLSLSQALVDSWAKTLGKHHVSKSLATRVPLPLSTAGFKEFEGAPQYRRLFEKSVECVKRDWQDGCAELASVVEAPEFFGFSDEPDRMARAYQSLHNELVVAALEANGNAFDGLAFFHASHLVNGLNTAGGTYANTFSGGGTTLTAANLKLAKERFGKMKAPNGKPLGLRMTDILVPSALEEDCRDLLENDLLIETVGSSFGAVDNRHKGTVRMHVSAELSSDTGWYAIAGNTGMKPWIVCATGDAPEIMMLDKTSALYETKRQVGVDAMASVAAALLLPQCIQRYVGA